MTGSPALADLVVHACGLAHEGRPGRDFCAKGARATNLACAHTMARYVLRDALEARRAGGDLSAAADLEEWAALDVGIGLADHARSEAEKRGDRAGAEAAIATHRDLSRRLAALLERARGG